MQSRAIADGITVSDPQTLRATGIEPDVMLLNEYTTDYALDMWRCPTFNLIHSTYNLDRPIDHGITKYFIARPDLRHLKEDAILTPIPIPFDEFQEIPQEEHSDYRILSLSSIDPIRVPMFRDLVERARRYPEHTVWVKGSERMHVPELHTNLSNLIYDPIPTSNPIDNLAWADEVAGIFVGTITLEAWAMGKKTSVYDEAGHWEYKEPPSNFREQHDVKQVARIFLNSFYASMS